MLRGASAFGRSHVSNLRHRRQLGATRASLLGLVLVFGLACQVAWAQPGAMPADAPVLLLPSDQVTVTGDTVRLRVRGGDTSYVAGLGWLSGWPFPGPVVRDDGRVLIAAEVAEALELPYLSGLRTGADGATTRLVLDVPGASAAVLEGTRLQGLPGEGETTTLPLPGVLVPEGFLLESDGLSVRSLPADGEGPARVVVSTPEAQLNAFPLADPPRVVVDLAPLGLAADPPPAELSAPEPHAGSGPYVPLPGAFEAPEPERDEPVQLAPGVSYLRTRATGRNGTSVVHVVELDPDTTDLRVVGRSGEGRPVAAWADGGVAAINAGYFDPANFEAIGLRRIAGTLLSLPSRGRAAVGFGPTGTVVARADARVQVRVDGRIAIDRVVGNGSELALSRTGGRPVGTPRQGVVTVAANGQVTGNTIGPARVPAGGFALIYDAALRPLALLEPGRRVSVGVSLEPGALERSSWVVEAGPLLVQGGQAAFDPEVEGFARGVRILDEATQQAALGVRADGTVLFVVAERMVAEDLVPLFLDLGAEAALRLDSGGSATLVAGGRTVNRLLSRPVESAIVAVTVADAGVPR